jgi:DNA adenine methylase
MIGPISWIGGKNRLSGQIIPFFPKHATYVEPFCGGAQIFFHKEPSAVEVLNDLDHDVVNFLRVCQSHYQELVRYLQYVVVSREWFAILKNMNAESLTDIQRAARFLYLQKNSFAGMVTKQNYKYTIVALPNYNPKSIPQSIEKAHLRLQRVQIESLPYEKILEKYDRPTTLFYLDPPYWRRALYRFNFRDEDFKKLAERLDRIRGRFVLSLNDCPEVRQIFQSFKIHRIETSYSAQQRAGKRYRELLITNYTPTVKQDTVLRSTAEA